MLLTSTQFQVNWYKNHVPIIQSGRIHSVHNHNKHKDQYSLRLRSVSLLDLGNYSCGLAMDNAPGHQLDMATIVLDKLPPPPEFYSRKDRVNDTSQLLTWTG